MSAKCLIICLKSQHWKSVSLSCTYRVQVKVSQCVLQSVVVFPDGDLCFQPRRKPQPVTTAAAKPAVTC